MEKFLKFKAHLLEQLKNFKAPVIIHHYDTDGISAGAIMGKYLRDLGKEPEFISMNGLNRFNIDKIKDIPEKIILDFGTNIVEQLGESIIIDHHYPRVNNIHRNLLNSFFVDMNGDRGISASGLTSLVTDMREATALLGAVGDRQFPFVEHNRELLNRAISNNQIIKKRDLKIYGKYSRPLFVMLGYLFEDFAEDRKQAINFIRSLGIRLKDNEKWRYYKNLDDRERHILIRAVIEKAARLGKLEEAYGDVYILRNMVEIDINELTSIINATGRKNRADIGREIALGNRDYLDIGVEILRSYQSKLRDAIIYAKNNIDRREGYMYVDGRDRIDPSILGVVLSIINEFKDYNTIVGISKEENGILKVSIRSNEINVGSLIDRVISENRDWEGGGHEGAGGFTIPEDSLDRLIAEIDKNIKIFKHNTIP
ncbi:MAG: DHHA1 domain-containing protein [Candidatus Anstonellales archaeon]